MTEDQPLIGVPGSTNQQRLMGELCAWVDRPPDPSTPMTDAEWAVCCDPRDMLQTMSGRLSNRVLHLFAAACVRRVWHLFRDERGQRAVEAAEQFANGFIRDVDLAAAHAAITRIPPPAGHSGAFAGAWYASCANAWYAAWFGSWHAAEAVGAVACAGIIWQQADYVREAFRPYKGTEDVARDVELAAQASLLRAVLEASSLKT